MKKYDILKYEFHYCARNPTIHYINQNNLIEVVEFSRKQFQFCTFLVCLFFSNLYFSGSKLSFQGGKGIGLTTHM